ncbi:hypothetical protein MmiAt1_03230 [Methanimicrococcus sp. At1]|uniref:Zinc-ribbon domain-containing protein n=1 Tax=Methanimicrococcus hacksteinii TaxID=3028293 RepID=A0ABU3VMZ8_9EURY|nr:DUF5683 domain-containing protein [Methanimicrococcus sp. At1]MDV0444783.1 hypothetical protein [Methanimicrococcus sp. At1]
MANNYCSNCGEPLKEFALVCSQCGMPVKNEKAQENAENTEKSEKSESQTYSEDTSKAEQAEQVYDKDIPKNTMKKEKNTFFALILSFIIPGLGQVYNGNFWKGVGFMIAVPLGTLFLIVPGVAIWIWGMYDAYTDADKINNNELPYKEPTVWEIIIFLLLPILFWVALAFIAIAFFMLIAIPVAIIA